MTSRAAAAGGRRAVWNAQHVKGADDTAGAGVQMEERLRVDASDEDARAHIFALIDQSIANMLAPMGDTAHRIAANFRP